jgi:hypothetical protein
LLPASRDFVAFTPISLFTFDTVSLLSDAVAPVGAGAGVADTGRHTPDWIPNKIENFGNKR